MDLQLHNEHVLITGGSKGMACAKASYRTDICMSMDGAPHPIVV